MEPLLTFTDFKWNHNSKNTLVHFFLMVPMCSFSIEECIFGSMLFGALPIVHGCGNIHLNMNKYFVDSANYALDGPRCLLFYFHKLEYLILGCFFKCLPTYSVIFNLKMPLNLQMYFSLLYLKSGNVSISLVRHCI